MDAPSPDSCLVEPLHSPSIRLKYTLDRLLGLAAIAALGPLLGCIALAVWLDDGSPIFFVQQRPGLCGRSFRCFKYRTMIREAEQFMNNEGSPTRSRVTRVGHYLRLTSLDELPQLLNVAMGEMSFVGPRPPLMDHLRRYTTDQMQRFRMKPGITGLAQISGRNTLKWSHRIALDNEYIDNWTLLIDLHILARTVGVVLRREGVVADRNPGDVDDLAPAREDC